MTKPKDLREAFDADANAQLDDGKTSAAANKVRQKQAHEQRRSIEQLYAEHLLVDHGATAIGETPSSFHSKYYRQCPFVPQPLA